MPKKPSGKRPRGARPAIVEFLTPEQVEGHRTSRVIASGEGYSEGFSIELREHGVELAKEGFGRRLYPWARIKYVELEG